MSDKLHSDFDLLYDIKTLDDVRRIAAGEPHHSNATVEDLIVCYSNCGIDPPAFLLEAHEKASMPLGMPPIMVDYKDFAHFMALDDINKELVEEVRRFNLLNEASIEQMNENQKRIDQLQSTVVQEWLAEKCTWKMQTVLLVALRGCDGVHKDDLSKPFIRRMRATLLKNADRSTTFFANDSLYRLNDGIRDDLRKMFNDMDHYPIHWFMHFIHAAEIIMYKHPDKNIRRFWEYVYWCALDELHVDTETEDQLDKRLEDKT